MGQFMADSLDKDVYQRRRTERDRIVECLDAEIASLIRVINLLEQCLLLRAGSAE